MLNSDEIIIRKVNEDKCKAVVCARDVAKEILKRTSHSWLNPREC
jgi:ribosomal protein S3